MVEVSSQIICLSPSAPVAILTPTSPPQSVLLAFVPSNPPPVPPSANPVSLLVPAPEETPGSVLPLDLSCKGSTNSLHLEPFAINRANSCSSTTSSSSYTSR